MSARFLLPFSALAAVAHASPVKSGHASAEWLSGVTSIERGKPFQTGIRLAIEPGWHSYWLNPGESGMKLKVVWNLPQGWTAGEVEQPAPKKFLTGELPGYGYEGTVIFPVTITPAAGASAPAPISATVSWLTCNEASCVPGKVEVFLSPAAGTPESSTAIDQARSLVPKPLEGAKLEVTEAKEAVELVLVLPEGSKFDPTGWEIFPVTEQAIDHYKAIGFRKEGGKWIAKTTRNPYAPPALKELRLVLVKKGEAPVEVGWKAN